MDEANVFSRLFRCARGNQENFLTESLCVVLTQLVLDSPPIAVRLLSLLTDDLIAGQEGLGGLRLSTQMRTLSGTPDIAIVSGRKLAYVEVKDESALGDRQLERYRHELTTSNAEGTKLVFLGRYESEGTDDCAYCDRFIRWFDVAALLDAELEASRLAQKRENVLTRQFVEFLVERGLFMGKIESDLAPGLNSLINLRTMILEAAKVSGIQAKWANVDWKDQWFGCCLDEGRFTLGMNANWPHCLVLRPWEIVIAPQFVHRIGEYRELALLDFSENDGEFYSLGKAGQLDRIAMFIRESVATARTYAMSADSI